MSYRKGDTIEAKEILDKAMGEYKKAKSEYEDAISKAAAFFMAEQYKAHGNIDGSMAGTSGGTLNERTVVPSATDIPSMIYGARSVFISAETLNVNGLIKRWYARIQH